jgi:hypothetical protein
MGAQPAERLATACGRERLMPPRPDSSFRITHEATPLDAQATVAELLAVAAREHVPGDALLHDIRRFYLEPQPRYSLLQLADLWRISEDDAHDLYADELRRWQDDNPMKSADDFRVSWADAVGATNAFRLFRDSDVECALGEEFARVRSAQMRTVPVLVRVPRIRIQQLMSNTHHVHGDVGPERLIEDLIAEACASHER